MRQLTVWCSAIVALLAVAIPSKAGQLIAAPIHETKYAKPDAFTWLEQTDDPAAVDWAAKQTARTLATLEATPNFPAVAQEIKQVEARSRAQPSYFPLGDRLMRFTRDGAHPLGMLAVAPIRFAGNVRPWHDVLDVGAYNTAHKTNYRIMFLDPGEQCFAPKFERCLIPFSDGGASLLQYHEFDLKTGTFVAGGFVTPPIRAGIAWLDADTLVVGHALGDVPALKSGFPGAVYRWRRGTPIEQSVLIARADAGDALIGTTALPGTDHPLAIAMARSYSAFDVGLLDAAGSVTPMNLPRGLQRFGAPAVVGRLLLFQLTGAATIDGTRYAADSLIAYDRAATRGKRVSLVAAAGKGAFINDANAGLVGTLDGIVFIESRNLRKSVILARRGANGAWVRTRLLEAEPGVAVTVRGTGYEDGVLLRQSGFLKPTSVSFLGTDGRSTAIDEATPVIDASNYVSEIATARSHDGTLVDYYLVRPKGPQPGAMPVIITAYGGYGVNLDPDYFAGGLGTGLVSWLERGGAYALAAVRGGGERGSSWTESARGIHRQRSYEDFAAVAEDLIHRKITAPRRIGVFGRSFGGLLAANMTVQRPDLFGAALVGVPIVDLFRLGRGGNDISAGQKAEVGDWDDPAQAAIMRGYSPYQNIRPGVTYPRILTIVSAKDGQVGPGHGRKFTAKLQSVGADAMLIEGPSGGHGFPDEYANPDVFAAQLAFFVDTLMPPRGDVRR